MDEVRFGGLVLVSLLWGCGARSTSHAGPGAGGAAGAGGSGAATAASGGTLSSPAGGGSAVGGAGMEAGGAGGRSASGAAGASATSGAPGSGGSAGSGAGAGQSGSSGGGMGGAPAGGTGPSGTGGNQGDSTDVTVRLDRTEQTMDGFGINDSFQTPLTDAEADRLFDPTRGLGLTILRIGMGIDGNPLSSNEWSDIEKASARGVTTFTATVWSAPANCKTNFDVNDGGHLLDSCYDAWSTTMAAYPAKVKDNTGVDLYAMTPQREPDFASCGLDAPCDGDFPSMLYTDAEFAKFVDALGPKLRALDPPVKLMGPDTQEWNHLWSNQSAAGSTDPLQGMGYDYGHALYRDTTAWGLVDILSTHQYDSQVAEPWPNDAPRTKPLWMTEMAGVKYWPEEGPSHDIQNGVVVAGWIHDAIVNGPASAWLWWAYQARTNDDNEGLLLKSGLETKRLYTLGNFSRFVRPGYTRVDVTGSIPEHLLLSAFTGPDGTVVVVAINQGDAPVSVPIVISGGAAPPSLERWLTSATDDLAEKTPIAVSDRTFTATLDGQSVTTFVGK